MNLGQGIFNLGRSNFKFTPSQIYGIIESVTVSICEEISGDRLWKQDLMYRGN